LIDRSILITTHQNNIYSVNIYPSLIQIDLLVSRIVEADQPPPHTSFCVPGVSIFFSLKYIRNSQPGMWKQIQCNRKQTIFPQDFTPSAFIGLKLRGFKKFIPVKVHSPEYIVTYQPHVRNLQSPLFFYEVAGKYIKKLIAPSTLT